MLVTNRARAYMNIGRWIADCPREHCNNAIALGPKQTMFHCDGVGSCGHIAEVDWPPDADEITRVLERRPVPGTRNWAPAGHRQTVVCGFPDGQTVADLEYENREHGVS